MGQTMQKGMMMAGEVDVRRMTWVVDPGRAQDELDQAFEALLAGEHEAAAAALGSYWRRSLAEWLEQKFRKSNSDHTRRAYERHAAEWLAFLGGLRNRQGQPLRPWEADAKHVRIWIEAMTIQDLSPATVNAKLSAVSSWYSHVIHDKRLVAGVERCGFFDSTGYPRANPFKAQIIDRPKVDVYGKAHPLAGQDVTKLLHYLEERATGLRGTRNYALILTFLLTGYRTEEVVAMKWGDITPSGRRPDQWLYQWRGKGNKTEKDPLPAMIYHGIVAYLKADGRWAPGQPGHIGADDYIWKPTTLASVANLRNVDAARAAQLAEENRHITGKAAFGVFRAALRNAGVTDYERHTNHDLRHTFARQYRQLNGDLESLRQRLHHSNLNTTSIYARDVLDDPVDDYSEELYAHMRFKM